MAGKVNGIVAGSPLPICGRSVHMIDLARRDGSWARAHAALTLQQLNQAFQEHCPLHHVQVVSPGPIEVIVNRTVAAPDNLVSCHILSSHVAFPYRLQDEVVSVVSALQRQRADLLHVVRAIFGRRRRNDELVVFNLESANEVGSSP
jgi:hypothetical protein